MREELENLLKNAYAPITNFKVASIVVTKDDKKFYGVNVEDSSTRAGTCAERNAIFNAVTNGYTKGDFKELHLMLSSKKLGTPCFVCRQMISELFDRDVKIYCYSDTEVKEYTVEELCPNPFEIG
jgi:cytidine deaminase